jgi:O-antigen/teichoic acid export membrane protein
VRSVGEALAKASSLAFFVVMARELGREGFGAFMFALALTGALLIGSGFGTDDLTAREVARDPSSAGRYLADAATLKVVSSLGLIGVAVLVVAVGGYPRDVRLATFVIGVGVAVEVLAKTWYAVFQALERLELVALSLVLQRTSTAAVGVGALAAGAGLVEVAFVYAGGALVGLLAAELFMRRLGVRRRAIDAARWPGLLRAGVPIGVAGLLFVWLLRLDVTILSLIAGSAEVGLYAAALRLVEGTQFIAWSFSAAMLPWLARTRPLVRARGFELALKVITAVLLPVGLGLALFARPIVDLVYGQGYEGSVLPLELLGAMSALYGVQSLASTTFIALDAAWAFGRLLVPVIVVNVALNLILIPRHGAVGAAVAAVSSSAVLAALSVAFAQSRIGHVRSLRAFGGPLVAAAVMVTVVLGLSSPTLVRALLAFTAYAVTLAAFELTVFRADAAALLHAVSMRRWSPARTAPSREREDAETVG